MILLALPAFAVDYSAYRASLADEAGWKMVDEKRAEGLSVSVRHKVIAGNDCLEGATAAELPADALLAASADVVSQPAWSSHAVRRAVKLTAGDAAFDYYQLLDNPFPIADRYWFVHATVGRRGEERVFTWQAIDAAARYPQAVASLLVEFPSAVETALNVGDWTFTPRPDGSGIRYRICTDAGGSIPRWAGEAAARSTLPTNLADLVKEVRRRTGR